MRRNSSTLHRCGERVGRSVSTIQVREFAFGVTFEILAELNRCGEGIYPPVVRPRTCQRRVPASTEGEIQRFLCLGLASVGGLCLSSVSVYTVGVVGPCLVHVISTRLAGHVNSTLSDSPFWLFHFGVHFGVLLTPDVGVGLVIASYNASPRNRWSKVRPPAACLKSSGFWIARTRNYMKTGPHEILSNSKFAEFCGYKVSVTIKGQGRRRQRLCDQT